MDFSALQGRWYGRITDEERDVEVYLDVNDELLFRAVNYRRGGSFRARQAVLTIEGLKPGSEGLEIDLRVERWVEDGADRTPAEGGKTVLGRCRVEAESLLLSLAEPDEPRPKDLGLADRFSRRTAGD